MPASASFCWALSAIIPSAGLPLLISGLKSEGYSCRTCRFSDRNKADCRWIFYAASGFCCFFSCLPCVAFLSSIALAKEEAKRDRHCERSKAISAPILQIRLWRNQSKRLPITVFVSPAEVYSVAVGTPVALRAPSVPTALIHGDESTLKTLFFVLTMGRGIVNHQELSDIDRF